ncbi:MAG: ABC transporter permease [Anaerolineae bacterium]|nr:ABC transporter permease [Anaerolineae bacterium]
MTVVRGLIGVWLAVTVAFFLLRALPGDPISATLVSAGVSASLIEDRQRALGLDQPIGFQYVTYLGQVSRGDLGASLITGEAVGGMMTARAGNTLRLAITAFAVSLVGGVALGSAAALSQRWGPALRILIDGLVAIPIYVSATLVVALGGIAGAWGAVAVLGMQGAGVIANVLCLALIEQSGQGYILSAYGKGLPRWAIFLRHRLRPVVYSIVPVAVLQFGFLLGGTVITETVFAQAGLGQSLLDGVLRRDYPVVQGWVLLMVVIQSGIQMLGDGLAAWLDPRIRERVM